MKITICGSIKFIRKMEKIEDKLKDLGHEVFMPVEVEGIDYWSEDNEEKEKKITVKKDNDLIRRHFNRIKESDAVLVVNETKHETQNYIGGNTFLEIGFAYVLDKSIYLLNEIPNLSYKDEIEAMKPVVLNNDLTKIKE